MTLMQSKDIKCPIFRCIYEKFFPEALQESFKELKECRSLGSFKLL